MHYEYQNLHEMLTQIASERSRAVAVFDDKLKLSYDELLKKSEKVGAYLQSIGIKFDDKVALCVTNSSEFLISYLAICTIGAVAVPLNTFLKTEEISYILNDCKAKALFASNSLKKEIMGLEKLTNLKKIIWINEIPDEIREQSKNLTKNKSPNAQNFSDDLHAKFSDALLYNEILNLIKSPNLDNLAHIIYTSGTTGKPKGAMISYKNIFSNLSGTHKRFNVRKSDRFIVFLPMFHSFTLTAMLLLPLYAGAAMVLVRSVFPFSNVLKQALFKRVSIFLGIPAIYTAIGKAKIPWYFRWFNNIRLFISGAAPLAKQTIDDFRLKFPRATLVEGYGLSECSPIVSTNLFQKQKVLSVGLALDGYEVKIVDSEMIEVKNGEVGEIIVKGDCVMQGYFGMPEVTDETIINGWLKTGDLGKVDDEGFIYIVDRKKDLIISKGINIYPREIEEIIYKLNEVEAAAVIGVKDEHANEEVVAFIQLKDGANLDEKQVKNYLKKHLANYKLPKNIYFASELPKNATGKVLKRVLKEQIKDKI